MGLIIRSEAADRLARELAEATGESIATAVTVALQERLNRIKRPDAAPRRATLAEIRMRASKMPVLDSRSDDDLLGYNEFGTFD
ncbi:type II toxin-antitoxin system VapB family antitoxin [Azospirillum sp.]|uniref:type II toxin-antitoxin system VapB family antitoxin n=1 Tax=Azospirillum sp. TaxID=34012 RepID=UPI002D389D8E|nr:type II toxin-antitoxin system VapB family antitoxin [Azospirillum sp.]HYD69215.1 type II toxin-antitoxin system VapB family antitoxin [Azospirillum sp.]